ncbi:MAG: hypothetical protein ACXWUG_21045 [Polyangiales bacterium]
MKVDRSRFLLLAAALSANACTINNNTTNADAAPATDTGTTSADSTTTDTTVDDTSALDASDAADATDSAETLCTDEGAAVTACSGTTAGGCVLDSVPQCTTYPQYFKPKVAKAAVDCLAALPTCEGTMEVFACGYSALEGACPDPTVDTFCAGIVALCADPEAGVDGGDAGSTDLADCKKYASGLNADGRARLTTVVTEGGCTVPLVDQFTTL